MKEIVIGANPQNFQGVFAPSLATNWEVVFGGDPYVPYPYAIRRTDAKAEETTDYVFVVFDYKKQNVVFPRISSQHLWTSHAENVWKNFFEQKGFSVQGSDKEIESHLELMTRTFSTPILALGESGEVFFVQEVVFQGESIFPEEAEKKNFQLVEKLLASA